MDPGACTAQEMLRWVPDESIRPASFTGSLLRSGWWWLSWRLPMMTAMARDRSSSTPPAWLGLWRRPPKTTRVQFIGHAIGNIASHEIGHLRGSWDTDPPPGTTT
jgi:hypothetical protein